MTVVRPNSIAGINSITVQTGQALNIHDASGNLIRNITSSSGVSTFSSLHVGSGTTTSTQGISVGTGCSIVSETVNNLDVYTNSSKRLRIQNDGKVGVNTDNAIFNNTSQIASASLYHNDPKIGVQGSIVIGNISPTVSDDRELAFYRRGGTNPGTAMSTHKMGRIAWYGSSNDTTLPDRAYSIECVPNGNGWTAGSNRRASITFNNHEAEVLRIASGGQVGIGTSSAASQLEVNGGTSYDVATFNSHHANGVLINIQRSGTNIGFIGSGENLHDATGSVDALAVRSQAELTFAAGGGTERLRIRADGRTSIGSSLAVTGVCTAAAFVPSEGQLSNRNLIINGSMEICQRYSVNSANNLSNATHTYHVDRFKAYSSAAAGILQAEWEDDNASDAGFQYSVKYSCAQADTSLANDEMAFISQVVELKNMKHLGYGLSWAKTCTLSFYAKSSLTGTYAIALINEGTNNRQYVTEFTISDTNWNRYTITIPGDTSGTWTSNGLRVAWCLAAASNRHTSTLGSWQTSGTAYYGTSNTVNFMSSASSRSFSLTGVQLEVGSYATPFEHRSYGEELTLCQRYYQRTDDGGCGVGVANGTASGARIQMQLKTTMRASPTVTKIGNNIYVYDGSVACQISGTSQEYGVPHAIEWEFDSLAAGDPLTAGRPIIAYINGSAGGFQMDAEL